MVVYWLFRLTIFLTRPLPLRLGYRLAAAVASICYYFFGRQRQALQTNAARVLEVVEPTAAQRISKQAFRSFSKFVIDFIHFPAIGADEVRKRLVFSQWTDLDEVAESGRGAIIVTMHFGSWDLGAAALAAYGYPVNVVVDNFRYERMNDLVHGSREKLGMRVIPIERAARGVLGALKRGELLAMLIDVPTPGQEVTVDFFGAPAEVSSAPARIALRTGALLVPALVVRGPGDDTLVRPYIDIHSAEYKPTDNDEHDIRALTQLVMRSLERILVQHLDQWYLFHSLWPDARPAGEADRVLMRQA